MDWRQFTSAVETAIREERMLEPGARVVVGFSGGRDSSALVGALVRLGGTWELKLTLAHLNHGLRGAESDADERFVREKAKALDLPLIVEKIEGHPESNLEEWARQKRYEFLAEAADRAGAGRIAVGHHADDAAETMLINLIRGAGPEGLSGIAPVRELDSLRGLKYIVRPLIRLSRRDLPPDLEFREDSSNRDPGFLRNRIRHELIPLLESMNPDVRGALYRASEISRRDSEMIRGEALALMDLAETLEAGALRLPVAPLRGAPRALRMAAYRELIRKVKGDLRRIAMVHLEDVDALVTAGPAHGSLDLPGIIISKEYDSLCVMPFEKADVPAGAAEARAQNGPRRESGDTALPVPCSVRWEGPGGRIYMIAVEEAERPEGEPDQYSEAWLDPGKVRLPLKVRSRRPGDRYRPSGMKGHRKLKDVMNQLRVPPRERDHWPLIADQEQIVWVPGLRPAQKAKPGSSKVLKVSIEPLLKNS
jgi:tRNA(Ile)-lysidine synthase